MDLHETVEKLEAVKAIRSKAYWLSRATAQLRVNVDEVEKAKELQEECRKALIELNAEEQKYTEVLRDVKADLAAISQTIAKLDGHITDNQDAAVSLLSSTCQPTRLAMNQLLATVGLPSIQPSTEEDKVSEWVSNKTLKRHRMRTSGKLQRKDDSNKDDEASPGKKLKPSKN